MFESLKTSFSDVELIELQERLDEYRIVIRSSLCSPSRAVEHTDEIFNLAEKLSPRDRYELEIDFDGDASAITNVGDVGRGLAREHIEECIDPGTATYTITIRKPKDSCVSIYSLEAFSTYLRSESVSLLFSALSTRFSDRLLFECKDLDNVAGSQTIQFIPWGKGPEDIEADDLDRSVVLDAFKENSFSLGMNGVFLPSDFWLRKRTWVPDIDAFMDKACSVLSAIFISSNSEIASGEKLRYKILGYKTIEGELCFSELKSACSQLFKIYAWAYASGGSADRIGLARNVLSLHIDRLQDVAEELGLWNAIYSNYQVYLKENVASYLEIKNKISEFLIESTTKAHNLVDQLVESLKNSLFVMLTFLLSVVVVNGFKDSGIKVVFSLEYITIAFGLWLTLTLWIIGAMLGSLRRLNQASVMIETILKDAYGRIILSEEINSSLRPIFNQNRSYLVKQCWRYGVYWMLVSAVLFALFIVGHKNFI